jgi:hypothetical protein
MPTTSDLITLGVPAELAQRLGYLDNGSRAATTIVAAGTTQGAGTVIKRPQTWLIVTTAGGATGVVLPANAELLVPYLTRVVAGGTTGLLFPNTGASINGGTATTGSVNIAAGQTRMTMRIGPNDWASWVTS